MTTIHFETFGSGKPIVMVHGWAMHGGIWRDFALELAKNYRVTVVDLPGHGRSPPIAPFLLESVSRKLVEELPDEQGCWLGWSLGGEIVIEVAYRYPERVNRLILLAGTPCFVKNGSWPGVRDEVLDNFADSLIQDSRATLLRFLSLQIKGEADPVKALHDLKKLVFECPSPDQKTLLDGLQILKQADLRLAFGKLRIPVAAILGGLDTLVPVSSGEAMRTLLPGMDLTIIPRAGHVPFLSHRQALVEAVCQVMES